MSHELSPFKELKDRHKKCSKYFNGLVTKLKYKTLNLKNNHLQYVTYV